MLKTSCILAFLFSLLQAQAVAQRSRPPSWGKWEVSFFGGWNTMRGNDSFLTPVEGGPARTVGLAHDTGYLLGVRVTENLGAHFGAELEYGVADNSGTFRNLQPSLPVFPFDQKIHTISYSGLVYLSKPASRYRPFGTFGVGASLYQLSGDSEREGLNLGLDLKNRWKFAVSYGGGLKVNLGPRWGARFDVRDHVTSVPDYGLPRQAVVVDGQAGPAFRPSGSLHNLQLSAGVLFSFKLR